MYSNLRPIKLVYLLGGITYSPCLNYGGLSPLCEDKTTPIKIIPGHIILLTNSNTMLHSHFDCYLHGSLDLSHSTYLLSAVTDYCHDVVYRSHYGSDQKVCRLMLCRTGGKRLGLSLWVLYEVVFRICDRSPYTGIWIRLCLRQTVPRGQSMWFCWRQKSAWC